jgi:hypothetical protein
VPNGISGLPNEISVHPNPNLQGLTSPLSIIKDKNGLPRSGYPCGYRVSFEALGAKVAIHRQSMPGNDNHDCQNAASWSVRMLAFDATALVFNR